MMLYLFVGRVHHIGSHDIFFAFSHHSPLMQNVMFEHKHQAWFRNNIHCIAFPFKVRLTKKSYSELSECCAIHRPENAFPLPLLLHSDTTAKSAYLFRRCRVARNILVRIFVFKGELAYVSFTAHRRNVGQNNFRVHISGNAAFHSNQQLF